MLYPEHMIELTRPMPPPHGIDHRWIEGDRLTHIDGRPVEDVLDLYFYQREGRETMRLTVRREDGQAVQVDIPAEALDALTSTFAPTEFRSCACKCVFCFVDQNPPGLRRNIYIKDEDYRFSFLYGNYITLTSLGRRGLSRIIEQHLSPLYVSVHSTDARVRSRMLGLKRTHDILAVLRRLMHHGIELHTQIVLCPGWNDGRILEKSFRDLFALRQRDKSAGGVGSLVVVPVGLTAHRTGLTVLDPVTPAIAGEVIDQVSPWQAESVAVTGEPFLHLSDEFYLLADRPFPPAEHYAGFPQEDNGAGLTRHLMETWRQDLEMRPQVLPRPLSILTSTLAARAWERDLFPLLGPGKMPAIEVFPVANSLFGPSVTVAGLLPGRDLRKALLGLPPNPVRIVCLAPRVFNSDGRTLDGMNLEDITAGQPHEVHVPPEEGFVDWWHSLDGSQRNRR
jgi:putative radical SAM enzyme (TIGR03279 family)